MASTEHRPGPYMAFTDDPFGSAVWVVALVAAVAVHAFALAGMTTAPAKAKAVPITMAIAIPPPPPPPPPDPPPTPKPRIERPPETAPTLPPPPAPPSPAPPSSPDLVPQAAPEVVSLLPPTSGGVAVVAGSPDGTVGAPPVSGSAPPPEPPTNHAAPGPPVEAWDENGYKTGAWDLMNKGKRYPRKAQVLGLEGKCVVSVRINHDGSLAAPPKLLGKGTGHAVLDEECLAMAERTKFPAIPLHVSAPQTFRFPIEFVLENR